MSAPSTSEALSDHLLRTLAAVPVSSSVLELGCGRGHHTEALLRLGFPVHACDPREEAVQATKGRVRELVDEETAERCVQKQSLSTLDEVDATFDWIVAPRADVFVDSAAQLQTLANAACDLLSPGGWLYLTLPVVQSEDAAEEVTAAEESRAWSESDLEAEQFDADLVASQPPTQYEVAGESRVRALYRHVVAERSV